MDRFSESDSALTLEQVFTVERSYQGLDSSARYQSQGGPSRGLTGTVLATLIAGMSCGVPVPPSTITLTQVMALSNKTMEATTESALFRQVVRHQLGKATPHILPPPNLVLEPAIELGDYDFYDAIDMVPANVPTDMVEVYITESVWSEPWEKDLDTEPSYAIDELV
jgi:hypothetical protein